MRTANSLLLKIFTALFALVAVSAQADTDPNWGPELGSVLPAGLMVTTHEGKKASLSELGAVHGVAIAFVRSADWCPFCKRQIIDLNKHNDEFTRRGVNLVALSYDSVEILKTFADKQDINFTLVSDEGSKVIEAFGIRNKKHDDKDSKGYGIPHPGIMVFDGSGKLVAKFAEKGYRKRPPVEGVLAAIDADHAK